MDDFLSDARSVAEALARFRDESATRQEPVINQLPMRELVDKLELAAHARDGDLKGERLSDFLETYLSAATRLHHPGYLAHQVALPHHAGALASLVDGFTNNAMAIYEMGPPAAAIEFFVLNWLIEKVGWRPAPFPAEDDGTPHAGGVLTHGGSLANLTALIAARGRAVRDVWENGSPANLALLAPAESHYSIARAAGVMGIGGKAVYALPTDARGVIVADKVPPAIARARAEDRVPIAVVANACSTAVGLYDPLREIAEASHGAGVWLHVDGAHGASALLSDRHRGLMDGIERADSLVWDAHKLMRTPTLCAAVLVRDAGALDAAFHQEASYIFHEKEQPGFDFIQRTVECTKAGLGLRFFAVLAALGEKGLARYVESRFALAHEAYRYIGTLPDFECPVAPQANILCFRLRGSDELQMAVRTRLMAAGGFYISTAEVTGRRYLRAVFMNPDTTMEDVQRLVEAVREAGATLGRKAGSSEV
jgi:L-2,4-diaminobutyrate decarboxylase